MKQLLTLTFIILFIQMSNAQVWVELGAKGSFGMSLLLNKNLFDDSSYNHQFSSGNGFGGRVGVNFGNGRDGNSHGFSFDIMSHRMSQRFEYTLSNDPNFHENTINWKNLDLYLLYRYSNSRVYLELGPMLSLVRSVDQENDLLSPSFEVDDFYVDKYYSAVFGFGGYLVGNESFSLNFGFRIHYALQDFITEEGKSLIVANTTYSFPTPFRDVVPDEEYKATKPLFIEVGLELAFGLGEFAKASCSNRMHWFWSGNR